MKVAIMGAGAVGSYLGGVLSAAGRDVVLVGRPAHVEAVRRDGLLVSRAEGDEVTRPDATTDAAEVADADVVFVCVKSTDTAQAATDLRPHLRPGCLVVSVQNGIGNAEVLAASLPGVRVEASVVYVAVELPAPGHVRHHGAGTLVVGDGDGYRRLVDVFDGSGFEVRPVPDVRVALWSKLVANCVWNPLSAITGLPYGELWAVSGIPAVVADIAHECLAVGRAEGVDLPESLVDEAAALARTMPTQRSSTYQDLARGRRTEIDHLTGEVARRGAELGIDTPLCRLVTTLIHAAEAARPVDRPGGDVGPAA